LASWSVLTISGTPYRANACSITSLA
jgi:hypothetical protein